MTRNTLPPGVTPPGLFRNIDADAYHAGAGVSKSLLDAIAQSPAHCRHALDADPTPPTPQQALGTLVHCVLLEPAAFALRYAVAPDFKGAGSVKARAQFKAECAERGQTIITQDVLETAHAMTAGALQHPWAASLIGDGTAEASVYWTDEETQVLCRARPDFLPDSMQVVVDLKTARDASADGFGKAAANFRYHVAAAMYLDGLRALDRDVRAYVFFVIESVPPYCAAAYRLEPSDEAFNVGRLLYRRDLKRYAECLRDDAWPGYADEIRPLMLPAWANKIPAR